MFANFLQSSNSQPMSSVLILLFNRLYPQTPAIFLLFTSYLSPSSAVSLPSGPHCHTGQAHTMLACEWRHVMSSHEGTSRHLLSQCISNSLQSLEIQGQNTQRTPRFLEKCSVDSVINIYLWGQQKLVHTDVSVLGTHHCSTQC